MREKLGHPNSNWRPLSNIMLARGWTGNGAGRLEHTWKIKGGRGRHRELEISAPIEEVTLGGLQHD